MPPPPPPPPGTMGGIAPIVDKKRVKNRLHWNEIPEHQLHASIENTIWNEVAKDEEQAIKLDIGKFEGTFICHNGID
jgi:hypothetical protein